MTVDAFYVAIQGGRQLIMSSLCIIVYQELDTGLSSMIGNMTQIEVAKSASEELHATIMCLYGASCAFLEDSFMSSEEILLPSL